VRSRRRRPRSSSDSRRCLRKCRLAVDPVVVILDVSLTADGLVGAIIPASDLRRVLDRRALEALGFKLREGRQILPRNLDDALSGRNKPWYVLTTHKSSTERDIRDSAGWAGGYGRRFPTRPSEPALIGGNAATDDRIDEVGNRSQQRAVVVLEGWL
jgi:hypothetical protein